MQESTGRTSSQGRRNLDADQNARYKPPRVARTYERRHVFPIVVEVLEVQSRPAELTISSRKTWLVFRRIFFTHPRVNGCLIARPYKKFSNRSALDFLNGPLLNLPPLPWIDFVFFLFFLCIKKHLSNVKFSKT